MKFEQKALFHETLLSAFPTRSSLSRMLSFKLGWELDQLAGSTNLTDSVFDLIRYAESQGKLLPLLQAAYDTNPDNPKLKDFYWAFFSAPGAPSPPSQREAPQSAPSAANPPERRPLRLVFCHSARDSSFGTALERHLVSMVRAGLIERPWSPARIPPGADTRREITQHFERADLILLLISADFLAECENYLQLAQTRYKAGAHVIPIIVRPTLWSSAWFGQLNAYPMTSTKVKPVSNWSEQDEAWINIIEGLQSIIDSASSRVSG